MMTITVFPIFQWIREVGRPNSQNWDILREQFSYFLDKTSSIKDGEKTLLEESMVVFGSGMSDGN